MAQQNLHIGSREYLYEIIDGAFTDTARPTSCITRVEPSATKQAPKSISYSRTASKFTPQRARMNLVLSTALQILSECDTSSQLYSLRLDASGHQLEGLATTVLLEDNSEISKMIGEVQISPGSPTRGWITTWLRVLESNDPSARPSELLRSFKTAYDVFALSDLESSVLDLLVKILTLSALRVLSNAGRSRRRGMAGRVAVIRARIGKRHGNVSCRRPSNASYSKVKDAQTLRAWSCEIFNIGDCAGGNTSKGAGSASRRV
jgi:hypothetical protein